MARTITIRRTVTGPTNSFSSSFTVEAAAELVLEETIPDSARSIGDGGTGEMDIILRIPNEDTGDQVKAFLIEATGAVEKIQFFDSLDAEIASVAGAADIALTGSGQAFFYPTENGQTVPEPFDQDTDIAKITVLRPDGASGNITLYAYALYDPTP